MYIIFRSKAKLKTEVFLEIQAGLTKAYDLNVTDTIVDQNSGRGIWVIGSIKKEGHNFLTIFWGSIRLSGCTVGSMSTILLCLEITMWQDLMSVTGLEM